MRTTGKGESCVVGEPCRGWVLKVLIMYLHMKPMYINQERKRNSSRREEKTSETFVQGKRKATAALPGVRSVCVWGGGNC